MKDKVKGRSKKKPAYIEESPQAPSADQMKSATERLRAEGKVLDAQVKELRDSTALVSSQNYIPKTCAAINAELERLAVFDKRKTATTTQAVYFNLVERNNLVHEILMKLRPQHEKVTPVANYLVLEAETQALTVDLERALINQAKTKEEHEEIGLNDFTKGIWKTINTIASDCKKKTVAIDAELAKKSLPLAERRAQLNAKKSAIAWALREIRVEQEILNDIYPTHITVEEHNEKIKLLGEFSENLSASLEKAQTDLDKIYKAEGSLASRDNQETLKKDKKILEEMEKRIRTIEDKVAPELQQKAYIDKKSYAAIATTIQLLTKELQETQVYQRYISDKVELIEKDTAIRQQVKEISQLHKQYEQTWQGIYLSLSGAASGTAFSIALKELLLEKGSPKYQFAAEDYQTQHSISALNPEDPSSRQQFIQERDTVLDKLAEKKKGYDELFVTLKAEISKQQQFLKPLLPDLKTFLNHAVVHAALNETKNERFQSHLESYERLVKALEFNFEDSSYPQLFVQHLRNLSEFRIYTDSILESPFARNLNAETQKFEASKLKFRKDYPEITISLEDKTFNYDGETFPITDETTQLQVETYLLAREKLASAMIHGKDSKTNYYHAVELAKNSKAPIVDFVGARHEEQKKKELAERINAAREKEAEQIRLAKAKEDEQIRAEAIQFDEEIKGLTQLLKKDAELATNLIELVDEAINNLEKELPNAQGEEVVQEKLTALQSIFSTKKGELAMLNDEIADRQTMLNYGLPDAKKAAILPTKDFLQTFSSKTQQITDGLCDEIKSELAKPNKPSQGKSESPSKSDLSKLDRFLKFMDKLILPILYKMKIKKERPEKPGFFAHKSPAQNFPAFRESIMPKLKATLEDIKKAAPPAA